MNGTCKICGQTAQPFGEALILNRHRVHYFRCTQCGFVQTEEPFWLSEAYCEALSGLDVGAVSRNLGLAPVVQRLIRRWFEPSGHYLDYGAGTGLFVRLMRDAGFNFFWQDKLATNIFAKGFETTGGTFELLTAFEVFEHLTEPMADLEQMLACSRNLLFTTVLLPAHPPAPGQWWYYGLEHGQHVSFYTRSSLQFLAVQFGLRLCSCGELHLLTEKRIREASFRFVVRNRLARWLDALAPRRSLTESDYHELARRRHAAPGQETQKP